MVRLGVYIERIYVDKCVCGRRNIILLYLFHNIILSYLYFFHNIATPRVGFFTIKKELCNMKIHIRATILIHIRATILFSKCYSLDLIYVTFIALL